MEKKLSGKYQQIRYFGLARSHQADVSQMVIDQVYEHWDESSEAPPKQRPRDGAEELPVLDVLTWHNGTPHFPPALLEKFPEGSQEREEITKLKATIQQQWPSKDGGGNGPASATKPRVAGSVTFLEGECLDLTRVVDLKKVPYDEFNEEQPLCPKCPKLRPLAGQACAVPGSCREAFNRGHGQLCAVPREQ